MLQKCLWVLEKYPGQVTFIFNKILIIILCVPFLPMACSSPCRSGISDLGLLTQWDKEAKVTTGQEVCWRQCVLCENQGNRSVGPLDTVCVM